jgi:hypothetical protein
MERHRTQISVWNFLLLVLRLSVGSDRWRGDKSSVIFILGGTAAAAATEKERRPYVSLVPLVMQKNE